MRLEQNPVVRFLSTPSARWATSRCRPPALAAANFYPRPPRGGRPGVFERHLRHNGISIHALREEGDPPTPPSSRLTTYFYPRPPRGGRLMSMFSASRLPRFLSTPSARRATLFPVRRPFLQTNFYPRPPRGGRLARAGGGAVNVDISIHALREEGDLARLTQRSAHGHFYPRPPRGGRPPAKFFFMIVLPISIHALREEGDGRSGR